MSRYSIYIRPEPFRAFKQLPGHIRQRLKRVVAALADSPRPPESKQLSVPNYSEEVRRLRLDKWRVLYVIRDQEMTIDVIAVRRRPPYDYEDLQNLLPT